MPAVKTGIYAMIKHQIRIRDQSSAHANARDLAAFATLDVNNV